MSAKLPGKLSTTVKQACRQRSGYRYYLAMIVILYPMLSQQILAADKPQLYNHVGSSATAMDDKVQELYGSNYRIVNIRDNDHHWENPKRINPFKGRAVDEGNRCVEGYIRFLFIITPDGVATEARPLFASNPSLPRLAFAGMKEWKMLPARLDSMVISSVAETEQHFNCP